MYDAQVEIRIGEKGPNYGQVSIPADPTDAFVCASATFQLLNKDHSVVNNSGSGGTNFTTATTATVTGDSSLTYYNLLNTDTDLLTVTDYVLGKFKMYGMADDAIPRIKEPIVQIWVVW